MDKRKVLVFGTRLNEESVDLQSACMKIPATSIFKRLVVKKSISKRSCGATPPVPIEEPVPN